MKNKVTAIIIIALAVCCFFWAKSCRSDSQLRQMELKYETYRNLVVADNEMTKKWIDELESRQAELMGEIDSQNTVIASLDTTISTLKGKVKDANATTEKLRTEVQPVLDANPKVAELVASLDAGILLRDKVIVEQEELVKGLKVRIDLGDQRFNNQVEISDSWKKMYENEHSLRLQAEGLFKACVHSRAKSKLWGNVKAVAVGVVAGVAVKVLTK
jgi:hypothetical protein